MTVYQNIALRGPGCCPLTDDYLEVKLFYIAQVFSKFTINLTKISILVFYLRIFSVYAWFRREGSYAFVV